MQAEQQQPTGPNLFKPSILAWRANYLARKALSEGLQAEAAPSAPRQPRVIRGRRQAVRR